MRATDGYRRAVVGLGSLLMAGGLGLATHVIAGDRIGLPGAGLTGGDGLAATEAGGPAGYGPVPVTAPAPSLRPVAVAPEPVSLRTTLSRDAAAVDGPRSVAAGPTPGTAAGGEREAGTDPPPSLEDLGGADDPEPAGAGPDESGAEPAPGAGRSAEAGAEEPEAPPSGGAPDVETEEEPQAGEVEDAHDGDAAPPEDTEQEGTPPEDASAPAPEPGD